MSPADPDCPRFPPSLGCDCHVHVVGPRHRFPLLPTRRYTPMQASIDDLRTMLTRHGLERVVIVQPSFYGTDNSCLLSALSEMDNARGVAVLPAETPNPALDALDRAGIRGLRINVASTGAASLQAVASAVRAAAGLCERNGWHVQLFVEAAAIQPLEPLLRDLPVDSVLDHFGMLAPAGETDASRSVLRLLETGKVWVKISGAYRICDDPADARIDGLVRAFCETNPERIIWGSDWPHTPRHELHQGGREQVLPYQEIDTLGLLERVPRWLQSPALIDRVMASSPAKLYRF